MTTSLSSLSLPFSVGPSAVNVTLQLGNGVKELSSSFCSYRQNYLHILNSKY